MDNMFIKDSSTKKIIKAVISMNTSKNEAVFIMIAEKNIPDINYIIKKLNEKSICFYGGIFPGVIYGSDKFDCGTILSVVPIKEKPILIKGLDGEKFKIPFQELNMCRNKTFNYTAMIIVDGLTSNIALFLSKVFDSCANMVNYIGGGAGSLTLKQNPCVFTAEGIFQDAAIITLIPLQSNLGVSHGWKRIMGPIVATKTKKNIIVELNWENAFEVYKKTVEEDSGKKITKSNFFDIAKGYPFGIYKESMEDIVRDPIAVNDNGELICVGEVHENTVLNILKGKNDLLINAAGKAAENCKIDELKDINNAFVIDCISRVLFLGDSFSDELKAVKDKLPSIINPVGILTLGEISSYGAGYLEFFNKTTVVGVLYG